MSGHIKKTVFITTILTALLLGCSSSTLQKTPPPSILSTNTVMPTVEYTATSIIPLQTSTPIIEPTSTIPSISIEPPIVTNNPRVTAQCLDILS